MESKSGEILIENELDSIIKHDPDVRKKDLHADSLLVQTPSSDNSTLTQVLEHEEDELDSGCRTPTEFIFDPFAPGPEELCLAPKRKNDPRSRNPLCRELSLKFDLSSPMIDLDKEFEEFEKEEKDEIQNVCKSFLNLIISGVLEICEEKLQSDEEKEEDEEDGLKTPTNIPLLTGFADTCPGAPVRPALKLQSSLKRELCRKLEFDSDLD